MASNWKRRHVEHDIPVTGLGDATHVEVSVFYAAGGLSMFTYKNEPRGYWASVKAVKIEPGVTPGIRMKSFMLFTSNGFKVFLKPAARFSAKVLGELDAKVAAVADTVAATLAAGDKDGAADRLLALREVEAPNVQPAGQIPAGSGA